MIGSKYHEKEQKQVLVHPTAAQMATMLICCEAVNILSMPVGGD